MPADRRAQWRLLLKKTKCTGTAVYSSIGRSSRVSWSEPAPVHVHPSRRCRLRGGLLHEMLRHLQQHQHGPYVTCHAHPSLAPALA